MKRSFNQYFFSLYILFLIAYSFDRVVQGQKVKLYIYIYHTHKLYINQI